MGRRGKKPKSAAELRLTGQYREDRHAGRGRFEGDPTSPRRPRILKDKEAIWLWELITPWLFSTGVATAQDVPAWAGICRWYAEWRKADRALQSTLDPVEKRHAIATCKVAWREWMAGAARFGLTPADRASIGVASNHDPEEFLSAYLEQGPE